MSFSKKVKLFTEKSLDRANYVVGRVAEMIAEDANLPVSAGGRRRVDTGFLGKSLVVKVNNKIHGSGEAAFFGLSSKQVLNQVITIGWTAKYARHQEYGTKYISPSYFARGAVEKFGQFAKKATEEANAKFR